MEPADRLAVLTHSVALAAKRWYYDATGRVKCEEYSKKGATFFNYDEYEIGDLASLAEVLDELTTSPRSYVVRAEILPGFDPTSIRRAVKASADGPACMRIRAHQWFMVDLDLKDKSEWDYSTEEACARVAKTALGKLPMELRVAGHYWQLSSSAGMKPGLRAHFWFWLDRVIDNTFLTRYATLVNDASGGAILIDPALFRNPVQPHYIANPTFDGMPDPVKLRTGLVEGPPASLPKLLTPQGAWRRLVEPLFRPSNGVIHEHVLRACASYFCGNGPDASDAPLREALDAAVKFAEEQQNRVGEYTATGKLDAEIASGRVFARHKAQSGERLITDKEGNPKGTVGNLISIMESHADWQDLLRWNKRALHIEIIRTTPWGAPPGRWIAARDNVRAAQWFVQNCRCPAEADTTWRAAIAFARETEIDPWADELLALVHDGHQRLDHWLIEWCGADDTNYVSRVGRLYLIGLVARALDPGCQMDTVLCLSGDQGAKKTSLLRVLGGKYYAAVVEEKDMVQKLHGPGLVELPELGPFRQADYNHMKGIVDQRVDHFRAPYMADVEDVPRGCVLAMTDNPDEVGWQRDPTGGRRWWPVTVRNIDLETMRLARDQILAEAVAAYLAGEEWWVEVDDPDFVAAQNSVRTEDPWLPRIQSAVDGHAKSWGGPGGTLVTLDARIGFSLSDVMIVALGDNRQSRQDAARATACLVRLGFKREGVLWRK